MDFSRNKLFSLSPYTEKILNKLKKKVTFTVFNNLDYNDPFPEILALYQERSSKINFRFIDPARNIKLREKYNIKNMGTVIATCSNYKPLRFNYTDFYKLGRKNSRETVELLRYEKMLTAVLYNFMNPGSYRCLLIDGHQENNSYSLENYGISKFKAALNIDKILLKKAPLSAGLLKNADLVIVSGPQKDYSYKEILHLKRYIENEKSVLFLLDPFNTNKEPLNNLKKLLGEYNIVLRDDLVIDKQHFFYEKQNRRGSPLYPAVQYDYHSIVNELDKYNLTSYLYRCRSIKLPPKKSKIRIEPFIKSFNAAWGETAAPEIYFDKNDIRGPLVLGAGIQAPGIGRLAVIGDSDFIRNRFIDTGGNKDLILNVVNWLLYRENKVSVRAKQIKNTKIALGTSQQKLFYWLFSVIIPLLIIIFGLVIYFIKRSFKLTYKGET